MVQIFEICLEMLQVLEDVPSEITHKNRILHWMFIQFLFSSVPVVMKNELYKFFWEPLVCCWFILLATDFPIL
jgi:hypothetical protein